MTRHSVAIMCLLGGLGAVALTSESRAGNSDSIQMPSSLEVLSAPDAGVEELVLRVDAGIEIPSSGLLVEGATAVRLVPVQRCGANEEVSQARREPIPKSIEREIAREPFLPRTIPINFHVLVSSEGEGAVSDGAIDEQLKVLNEDFAGTGFSFVRRSIRRTINDSWFKMGKDTFLEMRVKDKLAVKPETQLNIYLADGDGYLGWATYPWDPMEQETHGVVLNFRTLPGSTYVPYNTGRTATHEVGHFLGLLHTFEGGCEPPGDGVSDTEAEAEPHFGCEIGRDSCSGGGPDPVTNFMGYSTDVCMTGFSREQTIRMQVEVMANRSRWQLGGANSHGLTNVEPRARFGDAEVMRARLLTIDALLKESNQVSTPAGP